MTDLTNIVEILAKQALGSQQQSGQGGGLGGILGSVLGQLGGQQQQNTQNQQKPKSQSLYNTTNRKHVP